MAVTTNRNHAIGILDKIISEGRDRASQNLIAIEREWDARKDLMVRPEAMTFDVTDGNVHPVIEKERFNLTPHSLDQLYSRARVPRKFGDELFKVGRGDMVKYNLEELMPQVSKEGMLVRHVGSTIKGVLSTAYRRMDASPIFESFIKSGMGQGFVPFRGNNTDTRYRVSMIHPEVLEPTPGEFVVYGSALITGDYGGVALAMEVFALRIICNNLMQGMNLLRQIHIGKRFDFSGEKGPVIELSSRTHQLDTHTVASAIGDAVKGVKEWTGTVNKAIEKASKEEVNIDTAVALLRKKGLRKEVADSVKALYNSEVPVEALPQEKSKWRLSNCISLIANGEKNGDREIDLQKLAYDVVAA